jgi:LPPG:FO 2-phospho-L-lactate transferase
MTATITRFPGPSRPCDKIVVALCGGVGGAKLAHGLYQILDPGALHVVVNTADDFQHLSLHISPDLDTVLYTLGGRADMDRGWGRSEESWRFLGALEEVGGETWFQLGDQDLAMHVLRTHWLDWGKPLSAFAQHVARKFDIAAQIIPMTDDTVATWVTTDDGLMPFQQYFVREKCEPRIRAIHFEGAGQAKPPAAAIAALKDPRLKAIIICPSNPYLSIDPILSIPGIKDAVLEASCPVVAVSPIIKGRSVKGPTAKIMTELGIHPSWEFIARHYRGLIDGLLIEDGDSSEGNMNFHLSVQSAPILMKTLEDRRRLGETVITFAESLQGQPRRKSKPPPVVLYRT